MSLKTLDCNGRWRNKIVSFRMSEQENELLNIRVKLSGLAKQDYLIKRCFEKDIVVNGNPRVFKALKSEIDLLLAELKQLDCGSNISKETLDKLEYIIMILDGLKEKNPCSKS